MSGYYKRMGRLQLEVTENGAKDPSYAHGAKIMCPTGWNDSCRIETFVVSVEELRDLRYLIDRAITHVEWQRQ